MIDSKLEHVTRAIYERRNGAGCKPWGRLPQALRDPYRGDARADIKDMQELTNALAEERRTAA